MIEIVAVLMLICIIGAVIVVADVYSTSEYNLTSQTEIIKSHLRYAQSRSMSGDTVWGIDFVRSGGTSYYYLFRGDTGNSKILPGEASSPVFLQDGVVVSPVTVYFDGLGKPYNADPSSVVSSTVVVTVDTAAITITKNTGFIP